MEIKNKLFSYGLSLLTAGAALLSVTTSVQAANTCDWKQRQWTVPLTAGVSQLVTFGKQSVSFGLDGRWYAQHALALRRMALCSP